MKQNREKLNLRLCDILFIKRFSLFVIITGLFFVAADVDPEKTIAWGPGLNPSKVPMRARYFFLQLADTNGQNLTTTPGPQIISATIRGQNRNKQSCRIWLQLLDCKDGSFIVRYRLYETCYNLKISVLINNQPVSVASLLEKGPVHEEECNCPNPSIKDWRQHQQCSASYSKILKDLKPFQRVDFDTVRDEIIAEYDKPLSVSLCHYVIKSNKIYRKCHGQHVDFKIFSDAILLSLARKVVLPDVEFFMNLGDWPLVPKTKHYPIFSWCGSTETRDIILPTYDIAQSSLEAMGGVMLDMLSVQGNIKTSWENKIEKAFWRGRDSRLERLKLIDIARKNPELFNASITNFFFFLDQKEKYGPGERHVSFFDFFKYKYQINIDGSVAAYRLPYLLAGDSLVFKQSSNYSEHFYDHLVPWLHYVPVKHDLSDLVEKIKWARANDNAARKIAKAGRELMRQIALPRDVFCYYVALLQDWSERIVSEIRVIDGMEEVRQPDHDCPCENTPTTNSKVEL